MDKYRKVKVVGKGNFGHAVLVQSVNDRKLYIMKVNIFRFTFQSSLTLFYSTNQFNCYFLDNRCFKNVKKAKRRSAELSVCVKSYASSLHCYISIKLYGLKMSVYCNGFC